MNPAYFHLVTNHIPLIGGALTLFVLLYALFAKNSAIIKLALFFAVFVSLISIPAYLSGEEAEEMIEHNPGIEHDMIHEHEESAEIAFFAYMLTGAVALAGIILLKRKPHLGTKIISAVLVLNLFSTGLVLKTAKDGGKINHEEIRDGYVPTSHEEHEEHEH